MPALRLDQPQRQRHPRRLLRPLSRLDARRRGPIAGTGWGCIVCNLPLDGAVAVLCDGCLELVAAGAWPLFVCRGWPVDHGRAPFAELSADPFDHDLAAHQADDGEAP
jgi:hypothetical protein